MLTGSSRSSSAATDAGRSVRRVRSTGLPTRAAAGAAANASGKFSPVATKTTGTPGENELDTAAAVA